ncbi:MAG: SGNH/GDSL hydrolase family protein [Acidobacteria bacterium]|nr:SGNH/GDSL hydrolase family protein [Acidobacteriota bacterium]
MFKAKLAAAAEKQTTIVVLGDSIAHGAHGNAQNFTYYFTAALQAKYGVGSDVTSKNFLDARSLVSDACFQLGTWTPVLHYGLTEETFGAAATSSSTSSSMNCGFRGDTIRVIAYTSSASKAGSVRIDKQARTAQLCFQSSNRPLACMNEYHVSGPDVAHELEVTPGQDGDLNFMSEWATIGNTGVALLNAAIPQTTSQLVGDPSHHDWLKLVPNIGLVIYEYGQNDIDYPSSRYAANVESVFADLKQAGVPVLVLAAEWGKQTCGTNSCRDKLDWILKQKALKYGYPFLNIHSRWGSFEEGNAKGFFLDSIHPSEAGDRDITQFLITSIFPHGIGN